MRRPIEREPVPMLGEAVRREIEDKKGVTFARYFGPGGTAGEHLVHPEGHPELIYRVTGPRETFAPGSVVTIGAPDGGDKRVIIQGPPPGRRGGSAFAPERPAPNDIDTLGVISADPDEVLPGVSVVELTGYGFRESPVDDLQFMVWDPDSRDYVQDPFGEITEVEWVDDEHVNVTVDISADRPDNYRWGVLPRRAA